MPGHALGNAKLEPPVLLVLPPVGFEPPVLAEPPELLALKVPPVSEVSTSTLLLQAGAQAIAAAIEAKQAMEVDG
jgi:hypothetical protein